MRRRYGSPLLGGTVVFAESRHESARSRAVQRSRGAPLGFERLMTHLVAFAHDERTNEW